MSWKDWADVCSWNGMEDQFESLPHIESWSLSRRNWGRGVVYFSCERRLVPSPSP